MVVEMARMHDFDGCIALFHHCLEALHTLQ